MRGNSGHLNHKELFLPKLILWQLNKHWLSLLKRQLRTGQIRFYLKIAPHAISRVRFFTAADPARDRGVVGDLFGEKVKGVVG